MEVLQTQTQATDQNLEDRYLLLQELFEKGDDIQKLSVIQTLPTLIQIDSHATFTRIIPTVQSQLPTSSSEFNIATSKVFGLLIEHRTCPNLLSSVIQGLDSKDPIVSYAWIETLLQVIPVLTDVQVKKDVLPLAVRKSYLSEPVYCRIASAKMLGKVAIHPKFTPMDVKKDVLPLTQSLSQDCHNEVRAAICTQLPLVAQGLGPELSKTNLLANLVELASDTFVSVRAASVTAIANTLDFLPPDAKKTTLIPLLIQILEKSMSTTDATSTAVSKEFGRILEGLKNSLSAPDSFWFLECYKSLANKGLGSNLGDSRGHDASQEVLCRQNCAYNLPAVAAYVVAEDPAHMDYFYSVFKSLAADSYYLIRRTVASSIHEIAKILGHQNKLIKVDLIRLLRDEAEEVLQTLVPHLGNILELFCMYGTLSKTNVDQSTLDLGRAILKCQMILANGTNWRLLREFLCQMEYLPHCIPSDFIHQHFVHSLLNTALSGRARPVRSQATRSLLVFLKYNTREVQKKWLRDVLISQLCYANCCYTRHIYICLCEHAMEIFSRKYFKEFFYTPLLCLAEDSVSNIRLCVVKLFPQLKRMLVMPEEKKLKMHLDAIISNLENSEKNVDVLQIFRASLKEMNASSFVNEEWVNEERRRQEEEERVITGALDTVQAKGRKFSGGTATVRKNSVVSRPSNVQLRSSNNQMKPSSSGGSSSEMKFLEQHFYTDAGVSLPSMQNGVNRTKLCDDLMCERDFKLLQIKTSNVTDDVKVNMRKMRYQSDKRHSSILSSSCLESKSRIKRRSLNLTKELSRIPTSNRVRQKSSKDAESLADSVKNTPNTSRSNLPVLIRRPQSELRRPM